MTDQTDIQWPWPTCDEDGCIGVRLGATPKCLAHAPDEQRNATLKQLGETGEIDARGVPITQALLEQILAAAPHDGEDRPTFTAARFDRATFLGDAEFDGATFQGTAWFDEVTFQGTAWFDVATFQGDAWFDVATFKGGARFDGVTFQGGARFYGVTFQGGALFVRATFLGDAEFYRATFQSTAWFDEVTFQGDAAFGGTIVRRDAEFIAAKFAQTQQLGPMLVYDLLRLDGASFAQSVQIEASSRGLSCQRARFPAGVQFRLRGAQIILDEAELPSPSLLTGVTALSDARLARREQRLVQAVWQFAPTAAAEWSERPRLLSVQDANVAGLTVSNVDLTECRFAGAHNLHKLRMEVNVILAGTPASLGWGWRQVIAEERHWRATRSKRWATRQWWPAWLHQPYKKEWPGVLPAGQIAGLYWALRKGREEDKDEVGAGDFYYGEMEMRRHTRHGETSDGPAMRAGGHWLVERGVLTANWLISGYGLRGWRVLTWLLIAVIAAAIGLQAIGFVHHPHSWSSAFLYTAGAVTHLLDPPDGLLTDAGQAIRIVIGLIGPVLLGFGFALLALPYRAKR